MRYRIQGNPDQEPPKHKRKNDCQPLHRRELIPLEAQYEQPLRRWTSRVNDILRLGMNPYGCILTKVCNDSAQLSPLRNPRNTPARCAPTPYLPLLTIGVTTGDAPACIRPTTSNPCRS
jgi:hypothetical protein